MEWYIKAFEELSTDELYNIIKSRIDVFVVEQTCPYRELDNYDQGSIHHYLKVNNEIAAYVRILPAGLKYPEVSIGRVLVVEKFRENGFAKELMQRAIDYVVYEWNDDTIKIQAQEYLKQFYSSLGFKQITESYLEDDIPHIEMIWEKKAHKH